MRAEVPILTRCCCCFPLRRGLIVWGYIKLAISIPLLLTLLYTLYMLSRLYNQFNAVGIVYNMMMLGVILLVTIADIALQIVFLVGAHKKEVKPLKVYYYYNMTILILSAIMGSFGVLLMMARLIRDFDEFVLTLLISDFSTLFTSLVLQAYIILLVRSEIYKLNNTGSFKFVNNAAEAQCVLYVEQPCKKEWEDRIYIEDGKEIDSKYFENLLKVQNV